MNYTNMTSGYEIQSVPMPSETGLVPHRIAVFGQPSATYTGPMDAIEMYGSSEAANLFGHGSQLHRLTIGLDNVAGKIVCFPLEQPATAGQAKICEFVLAKAPAANGRLTIQVGHETLNMDYAKDTPLANLYTAAAQAVNQKIKWPVTAVAAADKLSITTKWNDSSANSLYINLTHTGTENVTQTTTAATGTINLESAFAQMGTIWYTMAVLDNTDSTVLQQAVSLAEARLDPTVHCPMLIVSANTDSYTQCKAAVSALDSRCLMIVHVPHSHTPIGEIAADEVYKRVLCSQTQPNASGRNKPLRFSVPGSQELSTQEKESLIRAGAATVTYRGGTVYVDNEATTSKTVNGEENTIWRWAGTVMCDMAKIHTLNQMFQEPPFDDYVMVDDDAETTSPMALKPGTVKQYISSLMRRWASQSWSKNLRDMQNSIKVSIPHGNVQSYLLEYMDDFAVAGKRIFVQYSPVITSKV